MRLPHLLVIVFVELVDSAGADDASRGTTGRYSFTRRWINFPPRPPAGARDRGRAARFAPIRIGHTLLASIPLVGSERTFEQPL